MQSIESSPKLYFCTVANNGDNGVGIVVEDNSLMAIRYSILWDNGNEEIMELNNGSSIQGISQNIIENNTTYPSNLSEDPSFENGQANNYNLSACSPAIDAGTWAAFTNSTSIDLAGAPRGIKSIVIIRKPTETLELMNFKNLHHYISTLGFNLPTDRSA